MSIKQHQTCEDLPAVAGFSAVDEEQPSLKHENWSDKLQEGACGAGDGAGDAGGPPAAAPPPRGDHLATVLETLLGQEPAGGVTATGQDTAADATIDAWPSLGERAALWYEPGFWEESFWSETGRDGQAWRVKVDPLSEAVARLSAVGGGERVDLLAALCASPVLRERFAASGTITAGIVDGLGGVDALRVQHVLARGTLPPNDEVLLIRDALSRGQTDALDELTTDMAADPALALAIAEDRELLAELRAVDPQAAAAVDAAAHGGLTGAAPSAEPGEGGGWVDTVREAIGAAVRALVAARGSSSLRGGWFDGYADLGPAVMGALEAARTRFREEAVQGGIDGARVESRVRMAFLEVAAGYAAQGSVLELLEYIEDPYTRRRAAQILGREADGLAAARGGLAAAGDPDEDKGRRLDALVERCGRIGAGLAEAVMAEDAAHAESLAEQFALLYAENRRSGLLQEADLPLLHTALEAGYGVLGGSLRHGVATLENADKVFDDLDLESTALALRASDDDRPDEVVQAEYDVDHRLGAFFRALVNGEDNTASALTSPDPTGLLVPAAILSPDDPSEMHEEWREWRPTIHPRPSASRSTPARSAAVHRRPPCRPPADRSRRPSVSFRKSSSTSMAMSPTCTR